MRCNASCGCYQERREERSGAAVSEYDDQPYAVELLSDVGEEVEQVLAREDRADVARTLYELMQAQHPGRVIVLRAGDIVLARSDR